MTTVTCPDCGWTNQNDDRRAVMHSAWVHNEILQPGHDAHEVSQ